MTEDIKYHTDESYHRGRRVVCWTDDVDYDHEVVFNDIQIRCALMEDDNTWWIIAADDDDDDIFSDCGPYPTIADALVIFKLMGTKKEFA